MSGAYLLRFRMRLCFPDSPIVSHTTYLSHPHASKTFQWALPRVVLFYLFFVFSDDALKIPRVVTLLRFDRMIVGQNLCVLVFWSSSV